MESGLEMDDEFSLSSIEPEQRYIAFLDVLGFGNKVVDDFSSTLALYDDLLSHVNALDIEATGPVSTRVVSDSIVLVSTHAITLFHAANVFHMAALLCDCLLRGGIAAGLHVEHAHAGNIYVVSEPLVHAARLEKTVKLPCVAIHETVFPLPSEAYNPTYRNIERPIVFFDGRWIVNPFNIVWAKTAAGRVRTLKRLYPEFRHQYDWFLKLYDAVVSDQPLTPVQGSQSETAESAINSGQ